MPWQTTMKLQGQTYLGYGVSLNCMWCRIVESKERGCCPHDNCATPCMGTYTQRFKKHQEYHIHQAGDSHRIL